MFDYAYSMLKAFGVLVTAIGGMLWVAYIWLTLLDDYYDNQKKELPVDKWTFMSFGAYILFVVISGIIMLISLMYDLGWIIPLLQTNIYKSAFIGLFLLAPISASINWIRKRGS